MRGRPWLALLLLLTPSCVQPATHFDAEEMVVGSPESFPGFPLEPTVGELWVEAALVRTPRRTLGLDLWDDGVVAVAVHAGSLAGAREWRLSPDALDARLTLQDGSSLPWIPPTADVERASVARLMDQRGLPLGPLPPWSQPAKGYLFFDMGADMRVKGNYALTRHDQVYREVNLRHGLLSFQVEGPDGLQTVRVGLRRELY